MIDPSTDASPSSMALQVHRPPRATKMPARTPAPKRRTAGTQRVARKIPDRDANAAIRANRALELRTRGLTYQEVANQVGYSSRNGARGAIQRELQRIIEPNVELLRQQENHLYNEMQRRIWETYIDPGMEGVMTPDLDAMSRIALISKMRRELNGMDVPGEGKAGAGGPGTGAPVEVRLIGVPLEEV